MTIQVCVRLLFLTEEPVNAVIKRLIHLKQARPKKYRNPERKDVGRRRSEFPFHAESIYLVYDYTVFDAHRPAVTPTMVSTLKALLKTKGLSVPQCRFIEFMRDTLRDESEYRFIGGDLWKSLTGAPTGVGRGLNDRQGAQVIESVMTPVPHFSALCSALMYSRGVKHLTLEGVFVRSAYEDEHLIKWRWIIYALFHASATHSIRSLEIRDIEIVMEHLVHVREFLDAPQPLKMMYPKEREPPNSAALLSTPIVGSFVALAEHAPVYFRWNPLNSEKNLVASSANTQFRVVNSRDDKIGIIVTGYGDCWVRFSDVVSVHSDPLHEAPRKQWNLKSHGITELSIIIEIEIGGRHEGVFELLDLMGEPLTTLSVHFCHYTQFFDRQFKELLVFCPSLTQLIITGAYFGCLDAFAKTYESGMCQIVSLDVTESSQSDLETLASFAQTLGDPKTMLAQTLRHIRFGFEADESFEQDVTERDMAMTFLSALKATIDSRFSGCKCVQMCIMSAWLLSRHSTVDTSAILCRFVRLPECCERSSIKIH